MGKIVTTYLIDGNSKCMKYSSISNKIYQINAHYVLTSNLTFSYPSIATIFCLGRPINGWNEWKRK